MLHTGLAKQGGSRIYLRLAYGEGDAVREQFHQKYGYVGRGEPLKESEAARGYGFGLEADGHVGDAAYRVDFGYATLALEVYRVTVHGDTHFVTIFTDRDSVAV
jgi:hypothetical protein